MPKDLKVDFSGSSQPQDSQFLEILNALNIGTVFARVKGILAEEDESLDTKSLLTAIETRLLQFGFSPAFQKQFWEVLGSIPMASEDFEDGAIAKADDVVDRDPRLKAFYEDVSRGYF